MNNFSSCVTNITEESKEVVRLNSVARASRLHKSLMENIGCLTLNHSRILKRFFSFPQFFRQPVAWELAALAS